MSPPVKSGFVCLALLVGCGNTSSHGTGGVDQSCYPNGTCNTGLSCFSDVCVQVLDGGVAQDGGLETGDDGDASDAGVAQAATAAAEASCNKEVSCFGTPYSFPDLTTCVTQYALLLTDTLTAPGTLWTPASAMACAAATSSATCPDFYNGNVTQCIAPVGALANGNACAYWEQCASGACAVANDSSCGVCVAPTPQGSPCANVTTCAPGLACSSGGTCEPIVGAGAKCMQGSIDCEDPLACVGGVCTERAKGDGCSDETCAVDLFCSGTLNTCQPFSWAPPGGTCGWVAGDTSLWRQCAATDFCPLASGAQTAQCPARAMLGQACNSGTYCEFPSVCSSAGICAWTPARECK